MKIVIDIPDSIYNDIKSRGDDICDSFIMSLTRVYDRSAIEVFRAIQKGKPYVDSKEIHIDKPKGYTLKSINDKTPE